MGKESDSPVEGHLSEAWRQTRRVIVFVFGGSIVLIGMVLLVLPGPAMVVIPIGLAVLATEFIWARRLLRKARNQGKQLFAMMAGNKQK